MGRTKKNEANETPQFVPQVDEASTYSGQSNTKESLDTGSKIYALYASENTPLKQGRINVTATTDAPSHANALVVSTADNSINGLLVEDGKRLEASFVIPTTFVVDNEICVTLNVQDEISILRQTQFGTRMDNLVIL